MFLGIYMLRAFSCNLLTTPVQLQEQECGTGRCVYMTCLWLLLRATVKSVDRRHVKLSSCGSASQKSDARLSGLKSRSQLSLPWRLLRKSVPLLVFMLQKCCIPYDCPPPNIGLTECRIPPLLPAFRFPNPHLIKTVIILKTQKLRLIIFLSQDF